MAEKFIQEAIKRPGSLRRIAAREGGLTKDGKVSVTWARKKYAALRRKAAKGKLSESERRVFGKLQLFLKVLRPAIKKKTKK